MSNNPIEGIDTPATPSYPRGQNPSVIHVDDFPYIHVPRTESVEAGGEAPPIIVPSDGPENDPTKLYPYFQLTERQQKWLGGENITITAVEKESLMHYVREESAGGGDLPEGPEIPDLNEEELEALQKEAENELAQAQGTFTPEEVAAKRNEVPNLLQRIKELLTDDDRAASFFDDIRKLQAIEREHARKFGRIVSNMGVSVRVKQRSSKTRKKKK